MRTKEYTMKPTEVRTLMNATIRSAMAAGPAFLSQQHMTQIYEFNSGLLSFSAATRFLLPSHGNQPYHAPRARTY